MFICICREDDYVHRRGFILTFEVLHLKVNVFSQTRVYVNVRSLTPDDWFFTEDGLCSQMMALFPQLKVPGHRLTPKRFTPEYALSHGESGATLPLFYVPQQANSHSLQMAKTSQLVRSLSDLTNGRESGDCQLRPTHNEPYRRVVSSPQRALGRPHKSARTSWPQLCWLNCSLRPPAVPSRGHSGQVKWVNGRSQVKWANGRSQVKSADSSNPSHLPSSAAIDLGCTLQLCITAESETRKDKHTRVSLNSTT